MPFLFHEKRLRFFAIFGRKCFVSEIMCKFAVQSEDFSPYAAPKRLKINGLGAFAARLGNSENVCALAGR